ncbi:MAG TPA: outer membrane beta-barrel protein [Steroidobacteraceae bacterium]
MNKRQRARLAVVAAAGLGLLASTAARSEQIGFYFELSGGPVSVDLSKSGFDSTLIQSALDSGFASASVTSTLDDSDQGWGVQVGYRWNRYVAAELGYVNLGEALYEAQVTLDDGVGNTAVIALDNRFQTTGFVASVLGMFPLTERFDVHARAGLFVADTRVRERAVSIEPDLPETFTSIQTRSDSKDFFGGIGAAWNINDSYSVRVEYQRFLDVGEDEDIGEEVDVDFITLSILFR